MPIGNDVRRKHEELAKQQYEREAGEAVKILNDYLAKINNHPSAILDRLAALSKSLESNQTVADKIKRLQLYIENYEKLEAEIQTLNVAQAYIEKIPEHIKQYPSVKDNIVAITKNAIDINQLASCKIFAEHCQSALTTIQKVNQITAQVEVIYQNAKLLSQTFYDDFNKIEAIQRRLKGLESVFKPPKSV